MSVSALCAIHCTVTDLLTGYKDPRGSWMPPAQYITADMSREMIDKDHRHHSAVFVSVCVYAVFS